MKINGIDIDKAVCEAKELLMKEENISAPLHESIETILLIVKLLTDTIGINSRNSSKPPSTDPNRPKKNTRNNNTEGNNNTENNNKQSGGRNNVGGQPGHKGSSFRWEKNPDETRVLKVDKSGLPENETFELEGYQCRQVVDIDIRRKTVEYQAEVLVDSKGNKYVADFPESVKGPVQYSPSVKAEATYLSSYQLIPYKRICEHFEEQYGIAISTGSIFSFNKAAARALVDFERVVKSVLGSSKILHVDETGINIGGKKYWLHNASNNEWTWYFPHERRGCEAMDEIDIIPDFHGTMIHDHWKPYFRYNCDHGMCNAHHIRELSRSYEQDNMQWAWDMEEFLKDLNIKVIEAGGQLDFKDQESAKALYRDILDRGESECPPPEPRANGKSKRGRIARSKSRNLLERLRKYENEALGFMTSENVPFTNNLGERDIRMTKVQQKISGCFRSMEGAEIFCTVRSFISTCKKQGVCISSSLKGIFEGRYPEFVQNILDQLNSESEHAA